MFPVSYNTFGFTAILFMVAFLVVSEIVKSVRSKKQLRRDTVR